jgi:hypothetical protein
LNELDLKSMKNQSGVESLLKEKWIKIFENVSAIGENFKKFC